MKEIKEVKFNSSFYQDKEFLKLIKKLKKLNINKNSDGIELSEGYIEFIQAWMKSNKLLDIEPERPDDTLYGGQIFINNGIKYFYPGDLSYTLINA